MLPRISQPRREGLSKRGVLLLLMFATLIYLASSIMNRPLGPGPTVATSVATVARAPGWWCRGDFERINDFIEVCVVTAQGK